MKLICTILISITLFGCTSDSAFQTGKKQLEAQGYTNVKSTGYDAFCCGEGDDFSNGFTAVDSKGNKVQGCFCSGLLKGVTIRFE